MREIQTEIDIGFDCLEAWSTWLETRAHLLDPAWIDALGARILRQGLREPLTGSAATAGTLEGGTGNWREGLIYQGVNARMRAVLKVIEDLPAMPPPSRTAVFAPEALSPFAGRLRALYPRFHGSEFSEDPEIRAQFAQTAPTPIPHEDLCRLSLQTGSVDLVVTNDVLEHVADLDAALGEIARVLRPGGRHVGTHPFCYFDAGSMVRARLKDGEVQHLMAPEYHGDPINPDGALVFEIPGWDILERCRTAGFAHAEMRFVLSETIGCLSPGIGGIFVLLAGR